MRTTWWQLTGRVHVGSWRQLKHNLGLSIRGGQLMRLSVAISCLMMVAWHKVTRRKFEFYPETVACVCGMKVLIHCCVPVDGVWGLLSCMVWFPSVQERQHKMGVWSSLVTRLCESEALFPVWKNNIVFLSFCSHPLKEKRCRLRLLQHRLVTSSLFICDRCREGYQGIRCDQFLPKTDSILSDPSKFSNSRHKSSLTYLIQKQTGGKWRGSPLRGTSDPGQLLERLLWVLLICNNEGWEDQILQIGTSIWSLLCCARGKWNIIK